MNGSTSGRLLEALDAELDALDLDDSVLRARLRAAAVRSIEHLDLDAPEADPAGLTVDQAATLADAVVAEAARPTVAGTPARELLAAAVRRHRPGGRR